MDVSVTAVVTLATVTVGAMLMVLAVELARPRRPLRYWLTM